MLDVGNARLNRDQIAEITKNPRTVKAIENLTADVGTAIPQAVNDNTQAIAAAAQEAADAKTIATAAQAAAQVAQTSADEAALAAQIARPVSINNLQRQLDEMRVLTLGMRP